MIRTNINTKTNTNADQAAPGGPGVPGQVRAAICDERAAAAPASALSGARIDALRFPRPRRAKMRATIPLRFFSRFNLKPLRPGLAGALLVAAPTRLSRQSSVCQTGAPLGWHLLLAHQRPAMQ